MTAAIPTRRVLARFSRDRWTRAVYVQANNTRLQPLVDAGLLEMRLGQGNGLGRRPREYRLTDAGARAVREV